MRVDICEGEAEDGGVGEEDEDEEERKETSKSCCISSGDYSSLLLLSVSVCGGRSVCMCWCLSVV